MNDSKSLERPPLGFRVWNGYRYCQQDCPVDLILRQDGALYWTEVEGFERAKDRFTVEPATGFTSSAGKPLFFNDIIRFTYHVGDFAWESMDEPERQWQTLMSGKTFVGQILWLVERYEIHCPLSDHELSPVMTFGGAYARGAELLGNTNENPDWRARWLPDYGWMKVEAQKQ